MKLLSIIFENCSQFSQPSFAWASLQAVRAREYPQAKIRPIAWWMSARVHIPWGLTLTTSTPPLHA